MAFNKNKVMDSARRYVDKGNVERAIKEYLRVVKEDPKDVRVWLKIGDLHAKKGAKAEAIDTYSKVAKFYSEQGFYLKAVAVYKQILKLDPRLIEVNLKLAELYRQLGLMSDAMRQFEAVAGHFHREGKTKEALATVRQLVELDPENVATRIKLAELYSKEGMVEDAVAEFTNACEYLRANNRQDDFVKVAERLLWHKPKNMDLSRELAALYLKRNDPRRALQKLQACFKANPRDTNTLELLAQAFRALEQKSKTVQVLKELARVFHEENERGKAKEIHNKILAMVPNDADSLKYLGKGKSDSGKGIPEKVLPTSSGPQPRLVSSKDVPPRRRHNPTGSVPLLDPGQIPGVRYEKPANKRSASTPTGAVTRPAPPPPPPRSAPPPRHGSPPRSAESLRSAPPPPESDFTSEFTQNGEIESTADGELHSEEIAKLLTETEVYIKYGLKQKAIDHLRRVFTLDEENLEARERLKEILLEQGREGEAVNELMRLAEISASRDHERAVGYLREVLAIDGTYQPAYRLAEQYRLNLTGDGAEPDLSDGAVATIGGDSYEFDLDDFADADGGAFDGAGVTREIDPNEVEAMFEVIDEESGGDLNFGARHPSMEDGYPYEPPDPYGVDPLPAPPVFDPADAAAFDAEPGYDPRAPSGQPDYQYGAPQAGPGAGGDFDGDFDDGFDDDFDDGFEGPARTIVYSGPNVAAVQKAVREPAIFDGLSTAEMGPQDFDAQPLSDLGDFSVDFPSDAPLDRPTHDLSGVQVERTVQSPIPTHRPPEHLAVDTNLDLMDPRLAERAPPPAPEAAPANLEEELEEADFYISQQLFNDARETLESLLQRYPDHPLLIAKLQDIDNMMGVGAEATNATAVLGDMDFDDLEIPGADSDDHHGQPAVMLENPVDPEDADTHYDLGLAYKEMGLYDEAIKAFKKVLESPGREVQCRLMVGLCYREQNKKTDAISQFKAGLHAPGIAPAEQLMLYYEIAFSYQLMNDPKEAMYFYTLVSKRDPQYRDVPARMAELSGGGRRAPQRGPSRALEDAEAVLDSLLSDEGTDPGLR